MCGHGHHSEGRKKVVQAPPIGVFEPRDSQPRHDILGYGNTAVGDKGKQHKQHDIEDDAGFVLRALCAEESVDGGNNPLPVAYQVHDGDAGESDAEPFVERDAGELWRRGHNKYAKHDAIDECAHAVSCL